MKKRSCKPTGFTLVELLVVILIIAVLAVLVVLGTSRVRLAAETANSVSSMRQLQAASISYSTDHNGRLVNYSNTDPSGGVTYWYRNFEFLAYLTGNQELVGKSLGDVDENTVVPEGLLDPTVVRAKKRSFTRLPASFGMNHEFIKSATNADGSKEKFILSSKLSDASRTASFVTATDSAVKYAGRKLWWNSPVEGKSTDGKMAFRHGDKAVVAYFDGSTGLITKQDIERFDAKSGNANPFWKGDY
jgi:prepilin-type N-terminal cleavage/methylation domain-containing protein/prepilin-type processing-associated H-X9-DG protein